MTAIERHIDKQKSKRDWAKHRAAADAAVAAGADFDCAQRIGFAATSGLKVRPRLCAKAHAPVRWYAMTALQAAFSQRRAAEILRMSDAGVGNGAHNLRRKFPEKHVEAVEIGKRLKPVTVEKGRAA